MRNDLGQRKVNNYEEGNMEEHCADHHYDSDSY